MALPSQSSRQAVGPRTMMSRRKARVPGPIAVAAVVGVCGLALAYVVIRPVLMGPSRAQGAADPSTAGGPEPGTAAPADVGARPISPPASTPSLDSLVETARRDGRLASSTPAAEPAPTGLQAAVPATSPGTPAPAAPDNAATTALRTAESERAANRPLVAREVLLRALARDNLSDLDRSRLREQISSLNDEIIFSPRLYPGDPFTLDYVVQSGDSLSRIASRQGLGVDWRAIQRANRMTTENIRQGQHLKLIRGPFHAVVDKSDYRLDLFAGAPDAPEEWTYIRSFTVGLGEGDGTPLGEFIVKRNSRLINPVWVNPRTGQRFAADDPLNPIGERWIGIRGLGEYAVVEGYGIHGTIDPGSIGQQRSMGCVRLLSGDVELVYELLAEEISLVTIRP